MPKGERQFVDWLRRRFPSKSPGVAIGLGDDMAMLRGLRDGEVLITVDMLMDGVDFLSDRHSPQQIGRKALACSLSDCAAMAVMPVAALVSLALPDAWTMEQACAMYEGMQPLADSHDVAIIGGDTNSWSGRLVIDVIVLARPWPDLPAVTRRGAKVGDLVCVTGPLGGSLLGRHLAFEPRVGLAHRLSRTLRERLHAMMDISDGLSLDLSRLCEASGVGAELAAAALEQVIHRDAVAASADDGRSPLDHALHDGEDFELLCAVAPDVLEQVPAVRGDVTVIGRVVEQGLSVVHADGRHEPLLAGGWEHFRDDARTA